MTEAKCRQAAAASAAACSRDPIVDRDKLSLALSVVLSSIAERHGIHGADCVLYACVGAEALRRLGLPTRVQTGDAVWRTGPNDGDVLHHVADTHTPPFKLAQLKFSVFHAWISIEAIGAMPEQLVDFTTWQLRDKARLLDQAEGKHTSVEFCPDYLWVSKKFAGSMTAREVIESGKVGVYAYASRDVEGIRVPSTETLTEIVQVVLFIYTELLEGREPSVEDLPLP